MNLKYYSLHMYIFIMLKIGRTSLARAIYNDVIINRNVQYVRLYKLIIMRHDAKSILLSLVTKYHRTFGL